MKVQGYVIVGPNGITGLECGTFGRTSVEAWHRHARTTYGDPDAVIKRSRWAQKGWHPVEATLEFDHPHDPVTGAAGGKET